MTDERIWECAVELRQAGEFDEFAKVKRIILDIVDESRREVLNEVITRLQRLKFITTAKVLDDTTIELALIAIEAIKEGK